MAETQAAFPPIPGLDMIGRGVYLRPQQAFELKDILFERCNNWTYQSTEVGENYSVPEGYCVNDSPPTPSAQALNQTMIEESWDRFEKKNSLDTNIAVSSAPFSVDVTASQTKQLRSEQDAYYALRNSFIPLWSIYLPDTRLCKPDTLKLPIPTPFSHSHREAYTKFFERYGTHYVKRVWLGGKATLAFTIAKSSQISLDEIKAGIKASLAGGGGAVNDYQQKSKQKLQNSSESRVFGKGGDELKLAALTSLDEANYGLWLESIKKNPQVIEFDVCGIWTLIDDPKKSEALQKAYAEATVFKPVRVVFNYNRLIHIFRGEYYFNHDPQTRKTSKPTRISEIWPVLEKHDFEQVDAVFLGKHMTSSKQEDLGTKLYFFNRDQYLRIDAITNQIDPGYPKPIAEGWPGVDFERIDAIVNAAPDALYFFRGNQYVRFNQLKNRVELGYPDQVSKRWVGVTFDRLDAAVYWGNAKVYFFRGDQYIRYDMVNYRADPGYPKSIVGNYVEDWAFFE